MKKTLKRKCGLPLLEVLEGEKNLRIIWFLCSAFVCTYLSKFVYLLDNSSKQSSDALVNQALHVVDRLLVRQVQSELILHLETQVQREL